MTEDSSQRREGLLDDVRVLDFTIIMAGPYCTRLMADLGADVIKVETRDGDHIRKRAPLRGGKSTYFGHLNAGKKSLAIDVKHPRGREIVEGLLRDTDVLVENFRPGVMQRLGLGYEAASKINPGLVYCSISGFGQTGPWAGRSAYAPILHAVSGFDLANLSYQDGIDEPLNSGLFIADVLGGALAFGAIQAALVRRLRTGQGDYVDLSLMDAMLGLMVYECQEAQFPAAKRRSVYQPSRAKDGFIIAAPITQKNFEDLAHAVGHPEWLDDPRFSQVFERERNYAELMRLLEQWTSLRSAAECEATLTAAGVPCSRYLSVAEAMREPHLRERGSFATIDDGAGPFAVTQPAFQTRNAFTTVRGPAPELGADGEAVLQERLGLSEDETRELRRAGVLFGEDGLP